jgi:hypothetical protein
MHCDDVRVVERGGGSSLELEAAARLGIGHAIGENLDRHRAIEPGIQRAIHLAHAADAEQRSDFIWAEARARIERQL